MIQVEKIKAIIDKSPNLDAFGRLRVSELSTQIDAKQLHDSLPLFYDQAEIDGGGTTSIVHNSAGAETTMTLAGDAFNQVCIMQTKQRFNYNTGKSALGFMTFRNFHNETGVAKRVGYYNSSIVSPYTSTFDGFYLEADGTNINFVISKNGTNNTIAQSTWNGDRLNGAGGQFNQSGIDLDLGTDTGNLLLWYQFEWLGVGSVAFGFIYNGEFYVCHEEDHIGEDGVYMASPNHSLRYEIRSTGANSGSLTTICATFNTEGSRESIGKFGGIGDDGVHLDANNTSNWYVAIAIRLNANKLDTLVDILDADLKSDTNDDYEYRIVFNPTYAGTLTYNSVSDYAVEYALGSTTNTVSAFGSILKAGYGVRDFDRDFNLKTDLRIGANIDGTRDELVVIVKPHSSNLDIHRAINWRELS